MQSALTTRSLREPPQPCPYGCGDSSCKGECRGRRFPLANNNIREEMIVWDREPPAPCPFGCGSTSCNGYCRELEDYAIDPLYSSVEPSMKPRVGPLDPITV